MARGQFVSSREALSAQKVVQLGYDRLQRSMSPGHRNTPGYVTEWRILYALVRAVTFTFHRVSNLIEN